MKFKHYTWIVAILIIISAVGFIIHSNKQYKAENKELLKDNILHEAVTEQLKDSLDTSMISQEVTDNVVTTAVEKIKEDNKTELIIRGRLEKRLHDINSSPDQSNNYVKVPEPQVSAEQLALEKKVSEAYIESVWEHYCLAAENKNEDCPNQTQERK